MSGRKVKVVSRMAKWRIENLEASLKPLSSDFPSPVFASDAFELGTFKWNIKVKFSYSPQSLLFFLRPHQQQPTARFFFRVSAPATGRRPYVSPVYERKLWTTDDHDWIIHDTLHGCLIIVVEFLDLKIPSTSDRVVYSPWPSQGTLKNHSSKAGLQYLSRMLKESIHTDITISTPDGSLKAHKAILSSCSPVLERMFAHDLKEKESSVIELNDTSIDCLSALLRFIYGTIEWEEFWKHRMPLMKIAHKYEIVNLKERCEDCLLEDLDSSNVFERLQDASMYHLNKLKDGCMSYLFEFWKIDELGDELSSFFGHADRELLFELLQSSVPVCKWV